MKIDSSAFNSVNAKNTNTQWEMVVRPKAAAESDLAVKKVQSELSNDVKQEDTMKEDMLDNAVDQANKSLKVHNKFIERSVHEKTRTIMYVLRDMETNEVIREFPPKKIQDMIAKMWELAGLMVDERR